MFLVSEIPARYFFSNISFSKIERMVAMAKETRFKMSAERLQELKEELEYLVTVREKEVAEQIKEARSFGDLSENSEYDEAKTEQGKLYSKIAEIRNLIDNAEIITKSDETDKVGIGSVVTVKDCELDIEETYQVVGSQEADPITGKISDDSPFGKGLMGHKVGDTVEIDAPAGRLKFEILRIDK
jgi:transcription elongation factor GreA